MKKILIIGGTAESLINFRGHLIREILSRGVSVSACAEPDRTAATTLRNWGVKFYPLPVPRAGLNPFADVLLLFRLYRLLATVHPDLVLAYTIKPVVYGLVAAQLAGVKDRYALITGLGYAFIAHGMRGMVVRIIASRLYKLSLRGTRCVFFQNPDDRKFFIRSGILTKAQKAVVVNGSGVDLDYYNVEPCARKPTFLLIARLLVSKGIREYAAAAAKLKQEFPEVVFRLVGERDANPTSISEAELKCWTHRGTLEYLGRLDDVRPAIAGCSVFVLPSYREGIPRTVLEAMAMGRAIVTTDVPGCRETVTEDINGFLVPAKNEAYLEDVLRRFILDPSLANRMGIASRRIAEGRFDVRKVNKVMLERLGLYEANG